MCHIKSAVIYQAQIHTWRGIIHLVTHFHMHQEPLWDSSPLTGHSTRKKIAYHSLIKPFTPEVFVLPEQHF